MISLNLNQKFMMGLAASSALCVMAAGAGLWVAVQLSRGLEHSLDSASLLREHMGADMMHDALRGDVLAALAASDPAMGISIAEVKADLKEHEEAFKKHIEAELATVRNPEVKESIERLSGPLQKYIASAQEIVGRAAADAAGAKAMLPDFMNRFKVLEDEMEAATGKIEASAAQNNAEALSHGETGRYLMIAVLIAGLIFSVILIWLARWQIVRPLTNTTGILSRLAANDFSVEVPQSSRADELGQLMRTVTTFKQNGLETIRLRKQREEDEKNRAEDERRKLEATVSERDLVTRLIGAGLVKLAAKDLTHRIGSDMPDDYRKLREDFNTAMDQLEGVIRTVSASTETINSGTQEISSASDDLSRRTETQAANLEETAAAVAEITGKVKQAAAGAAQARSVVAFAKDEAAKSSEIVRTAIDAMNGIEKSSRQITQIIGVIDEIAFQTNLLALNAGVEAARAGEAGRGFAVVASEVRALAQRSADAAKEIKELIAGSQTQVEQGVKLVGQTGTSLDRIVERVMEINKAVMEIASSAEEQASGLAEVNTAVDQMDQTTQQNAAMVEEATAATKNLAQQSDELNNIISSFVTSARAMLAEARHETKQSKTYRPAPITAVKISTEPKKLANAGGGNDWTEF